MGYVLKEIFSEIGTHTVSKKMNFSTKMVLEDIDLIGFKVLQNYDAATEQMIKSLQYILGAAIDYGIEEKEEKGKGKILKLIFILYNNVSDELFKLKKDKLIKYMLNSFSEPRAFMKEPQGLIEAMVNNKRYETIEKTAELLVRISANAAKRRLRDPIDHLIKIEEAVSKYESELEDFDIIIGEINVAREDIEICLEDDNPV